MKRRRLIVSSLIGVVVLAVSTLTGCLSGRVSDGVPEVPEEAEVPDYTLASEESLGDGVTTHIERNIFVDDVDSLSDRDLELLATEQVIDVVDSRRVNAVTVFVYESGDDPGGAASARIEWAPGGDISRTDEASTGDYSKHEFSVERLVGQL